MSVRQKTTLSSTEILQRFKKIIIQFIDELIELFPKESDLIIMRVFFGDQIPVNKIADSFIDHVLPHKEMISSRNENFFLDEENNIFGMIDTGKVVHFKRLWTSKNIDSDDKNAIWAYFDIFIKLIEAYKSC